METNKLPMVSIVIPVYNGADYLREAIDCALGQSYKNLEIIVVNDGSNDNGATQNIASSYGDRIRYFEKSNGGVSSALNLGIKEMKGEYFSWLSHDDKYEKDKITNSVNLLSSYDFDSKLIAMCGGYYIDSESKKIRDMDMKLSENRVHSGREVLECLLTRGVLDACCMLIPRKTFYECGFFNEDLRYNQDALMWYKIFSNGYNLIPCTENRDVMYRLHANQTSKTRRDLLLKDSYSLAKIIAPTFAVMSKEGKNLLRMFALRHALVYCKDATNECIRVGKEHSVLSNRDVLYIKFRLALGKARNFLKKLYHKLRFGRRRA